MPIFLTWKFVILLNLVYYNATHASFIIFAVLEAATFKLSNTFECKYAFCGELNWRSILLFCWALVRWHRHHQETIPNVSVEWMSTILRAICSCVQNGWDMVNLQNIDYQWIVWLLNRIVVMNFGVQYSQPTYDKIALQYNFIAFIRILYALYASAKRISAHKHTPQINFRSSEQLLLYFYSKRILPVRLLTESKLYRI